MYFVELSSQARKDRKLLKGAGLEKKAKTLLDIIVLNPFQSPPPFERLSRELRGNFSRRLNSQHRLVYDIVANSENLLSPDGTPYEGIYKGKKNVDALRVNTQRRNNHNGIQEMAERTRNSRCSSKTHRISRQILSASRGKYF